MNEHIKFRAYIPENPEGARMQEVTPEAYAKWFGRYKFLRDTGLKDKNGKEIYHDDLVMRSADGNEPREIMKVVWGDGGAWGLEHIDGRAAPSFQTYYQYDGRYNLKIIGNLYEHPNLLT